MGGLAHRRGVATELYSQKAFQFWLAVTFFLVCFKSLKFTKNVPAMSYIGSTFSSAVGEIVAFSIIMSALVIAFTGLFNILLASSLREYGTFSNTLSIVAIDGLLGNMDSGPISNQLPVTGPIFYAFYLMTVLFVGFTILISIITDRYEAVKEIPVKRGGVAIIQDAIMGWLALDQEDDDANVAPESQEGVNGEKESTPGDGEASDSNALSKLQTIVNEQNLKIEALMAHAAKGRTPPGDSVQPAVAPYITPRGLNQSPRSPQSPATSNYKVVHI